MAQQDAMVNLSRTVKMRATKKNSRRGDVGEAMKSINMVKEKVNDRGNKDCGWKTTTVVKVGAYIIKYYRINN